MKHIFDIEVCTYEIKIVGLPVVKWICDCKLPIFLHVISHDKNRSDVREYDDSQRNRSILIMAIVIQVGSLENVQNKIQLVQAIHTKRTNYDLQKSSKDGETSQPS